MVVKILKNLSEKVDFIQDPNKSLRFVLLRASKNLVGPGIQEPLHATADATQRS